MHFPKNERLECASCNDFVLISQHRHFLNFSLLFRVLFDLFRVVKLVGHLRSRVLEVRIEFKDRT